MYDENVCIFCKIANGEMPSKKIYETESLVVILDINPANPGHCLVVPKKHIETIYNADNNILEEMIVAAKLVSSRLKEKLGCDGVNILQNNEQTAGQLVKHIHIHVIPRYKGDKVVIGYPKINQTEQQLDEMQKRLAITKESPKEEIVSQKVVDEKEVEKTIDKVVKPDKPREKMTKKELRKWGLEEDF